MGFAALFSEPVEVEMEQEKDKAAAVEEIRYLWAPDLFKSPREERYYQTFCSPHEYFIAESASPCGPFENVRRITYQGKRIKGIDPGVLVDDDGRVYIALPSPFRIGELDPDKGYVCRTVEGSQRSPDV